MQPFEQTLISARANLHESVSCRRGNHPSHLGRPRHLQPIMTGSETKLLLVPVLAIHRGTSLLPTNRCLVSQPPLTRRYIRRNSTGMLQTSKRRKGKHSVLPVRSWGYVRCDEGDVIHKNGRYSQIWQSVINNPHIAEERNLSVDDSGLNEEDKCVFSIFVSDFHRSYGGNRYGAVVRGSGAYIPPGARKHQQQVTSAGPSVTNPPQKSDIPKVSVNGPDGATVAPKETPPISKSTSPAPSTSSMNKVCVNCASYPAFFADHHDWHGL
jgi:hypothetical protein